MYRRIATRLLTVTLAIALAPHATALAASPKNKRDTGERQQGQRGQPGQQDKGYIISPTPSWVQDPGPAKVEAPRRLEPGVKARRDLLIDLQTLLGDKSQVTYTRVYRTALDTSTLREVSEPTIVFNPAYQRLAIHTVNVVRDGQRSDRIKDMRVEMLRREQQLERQMLDGTRTALLMLKDVRVGDVVELAYSVEGANPIFEGRFSELFHVSNDAQTDRLHIRLEAPLGQTLQVKGIPFDVQPERFQENGRQVLRVRRENLPAIQPESSTPPWFKVYPAIHVSQYQSWAEVDQWAQRLFKSEPPTGEVARRIAEWKARALPPEALLAEVLRFVQDDIRYFSVSLGESSHRPKPAAQTLADRMGDCKDKVLLLNTLLQGLGFDARPALVSTSRNRGIADYLPSHDQFDHVISAVTLDGQRYFLDATANDQGYTLQGRGYFAYGQALVVGDNKGVLQAVTVPSFAQDSLSYSQAWDISDLKKPATLTVGMAAKGMAAERWRAAVANAGLERIGQTVAGTYLRYMPGLKPVSPPKLTDQRDTNELTLSMAFELPYPGQYQKGGLEIDFSGIDIADMLTVPPEARRVSPFLLDQPRQVDQKITLRTPRPFTGSAPQAQQVGDRHFLYQSRMDVQGQNIVLSSHYERRGDEVQPADLNGFRDRVMRARQYTSQHLRVLLIDKAWLPSMATEVDKLVGPEGYARSDALMRLLQEQAFSRLVDAKVLPQLDPHGLLAARVLSDRAMANNLLGRFNEALQDADSALAIEADNADAREARGVAMMGLARLPDASDDFSKLQRLGNRAGAGVWLGISQYMQGKFGQAESTMKTPAMEEAGEERLFALIWLQLAIDRQRPGQGSVAIAQELVNVDQQKWPGQLLHYMAGKVGLDVLLRAAKEEPAQERLRMAEASFFLGQQMLGRGDTAEAARWFERAVETRALPYREVTLAQLELRRLRGQH